MKNFRDVILTGGSLVLLLSLLSGLFVSPSYRHTHRHGNHSHTHSFASHEDHSRSATGSAIHESTSHYHVVIFGWTFTLLAGEHNSQLAEEATSAAQKRFTSRDNQNQRTLQNLDSKPVKSSDPAIYQWNGIDNSWLASLVKLHIYCDRSRDQSSVPASVRFDQDQFLKTGIGRAAPLLPPPESCLV